jgi:endonuclease III
VKKSRGAVGRPRPRARESRAAKQARLGDIIARLRAAYPDSQCSLLHRSPFELLAATILSAQCTDARVNQVTPLLFERFPTAEALAGAKPEDVESIIRSTGFFRSKARALIGMAEALVARHGGAVPADMDALTALPGVGRKTANVVLGNAFGIDEGIVVDTHVKRLAARLGLTRETDPVSIEQDLIRITPRADWTDLPHLFIDHGRAVCKAPTPRCEACMLSDLCPSSRV